MWDVWYFIVFLPIYKLECIFSLGKFILESIMINYLILLIINNTQLLPLFFHWPK